MHPNGAHKMGVGCNSIVIIALYNASLVGLGIIIRFKIKLIGLLICHTKLFEKKW